MDPYSFNQSSQLDSSLGQITRVHILKTYSYYPLISFLVILMVIFQQVAI
jgi:hypothetical protein